jgi:DNA-binding transcriptional MerR regulator
MRQQFVELPNLSLKSGDIIALTGTSLGQLDNWLRQGLVVPLKDARSSGDHRRFSLANAIEIAQAKALSQMGLSTRQLRDIFTAQREKLQVVTPKYQAAATYVFYVEMVHGIARITGPWPGYDRWRKQATALLSTWNNQPDVHERILKTLARAA